jgi:uncharacterized protein (DUF983 family)
MSPALVLADRGYAPLYHRGETNRCPGCGHSSWHVGRSSAECGFCGTALAFASPGLAAPLIGAGSALSERSR